MLRLTPPDQQRLVQARGFEAVYGGSEANVAVSLSQMGLSTRYLTRVPDHDLGRAALGAVAQYGVDTHHCAWGGQRLGVYFLEMGSGRRGSKVLYDRQDSGVATLQRGMLNWENALAGATWLHWSGITPALSEGAAAVTREGIELAKSKGIHISCDLNYRANLWQYGKTPAEVMPELVAMTDVLLGDGFAFDLYFGLQAETDELLLEKAAQHFPNLKTVAMTRRAGHSATHNTYQGLFYDCHGVYTSPVHDLPDMLDRIGGGDAFMAGLIYGLATTPAQPQTVIDYATAAAALKHYTRGDFNLSTAAEVRALMQGQSGGKVSR